MFKNQNDGATLINLFPFGNFSLFSFFLSKKIAKPCMECVR